MRNFSTYLLNTVTNFAADCKQAMPSEPGGGCMFESMNGLRAQTVRQRNLSLVLRTVRRGGRMTRSDLVVSTGLTRSAIGGLVGELVSIGLLDERATVSAGRPGRPSPMVTVDDRHVAALGVEVGIETTAVAIVGVDGVVIRSVRVPTPNATPESIVMLIANVAQQLGCVGGVGAGRALIGVGVAIPALVRSRDNRIVVAPNLEWHDVAFGQMLAAEIFARLGKRIPVSVGNDADLGAAAEDLFGAGSHAHNMLYVTGEVGVGGAVVTDGVRFGGHSGFGCEFGHVPVNPLGKTCRCGSTGCWETEVGTWVLLERAGFAPGSSGAALDRFMEAVGRDDIDVRVALAEHGKWVGVGLTGLINAFDPELIVLGGFLARVLPFMRSSLDSEMASRQFRGIDRRVPVVAAKLGVDVALIGAAELALEALLDDPAGVVRSSA
jgi:predicted NBD/HSP70 family sugar kinase